MAYATRFRRLLDEATTHLPQQARVEDYSSAPFLLCWYTNDVTNHPDHCDVPGICLCPDCRPLADAYIEYRRNMIKASRAHHAEDCAFRLDRGACTCGKGADVSYDRLKTSSPEEKPRSSETGAGIGPDTTSPQKKPWWLDPDKLDDFYGDTFHTPEEAARRIDELEKQRERGEPYHYGP